MVSKSQIDKLGDRLRKGTPRDGDEEMLQDFLDKHDVALEHLADDLRSIRLPDGRMLEPSARVKTMGTLTEKLVRERLGLSSIRDIAGARVTVGDTLADQDSVRDLLIHRFNATTVVDRRVDPRSGYRAVHVIVKYEGCWAEIQVRTRLQHRWAEAYERVADAVGRGIRYGEAPRDSHDEDVVKILHAASEQIAGLEFAEGEIESIAASFDAFKTAQIDSTTLDHEARAFIEGFEGRLQRLRQELTQRRGMLDSVLSAFVQQ